MDIKCRKNNTDWYILIYFKDFMASFLAMAASPQH